MIFHDAGQASGPAALARRLALMALAVLATTLWLGGWYDPAGVLARAPSSVWSISAGVIIFAGKCVLLLGAQHVARRLFTTPTQSMPYATPRCGWILLTTAALNLLVGATYAWLVEPLTAFQRFMHGALTLLGASSLLAAAAFIGWALLARRSAASGPAAQP